MYSKLFHNNVHSRKWMMEHLQIITLQTRCCCYITTDEPIMFSLFIFTFSRYIYEWGRTCKNILLLSKNILLLPRKYFTLHPRPPPRIQPLLTRSTIG